MQFLWILFAAIGGYAVLSSLGNERQRLINARPAQAPHEVESAAAASADAAPH